MVKDKNNYIKLFGYSLLEASVVLIIVSVIISLSSNVVVKKINSKTNSKPHGRFECYYVGNQLMEHSVINGRDFGVKQSSKQDYCLFQPNQYVKYLVANIVGAGAPATENSGGGAGEFKSIFFSSPSTQYLLYPGKPVNSAGALTNTQIKSMKSYIKLVKISVPNAFAAVASGGVNDTNITNISPDRLQNCLVVKTNPDYDCGTSPSCTIVDTSYNASSDSVSDQLKCSPEFTNNLSNCVINDKKIIVNYCRNSNKYKTVEYKLSDILSSGQAFKSTDNPNVWHYYSDIFYRENDCHAYPTTTNMSNDSETCKQMYNMWDKNKFESVSGVESPCLFKLELQFDIPKNNDGEVSQMTRFVKSMQLYETKNNIVDINSGIAAVSPGDGGSKASTAGHTGGIVLLY